MKLLLLLAFIVTFAFAAAAQPAKISPDAARRIAAATPAALPQSPTDGRPRSDAQEAGLKGKVLSVTYRRSNVGDRRYPKKVLNEEQFYAEDGSLIRSVDWEDKYPTGVTVYGYIDGMRVTRYGDIVYAPGEKPEESCIPLVHTLPGPEDKAKSDERYDNRWLYKYDAQGRIVEEHQIGSGGQPIARVVYTYEPGNRRVLLHYIGGATDPIAKTIEITDPATGDMVEEHLHDENGSVNLIRYYTYKYDPRGNWTVQKVTEKDPFENSNPKLESYTYRTIAYYP